MSDNHERQQVSSHIGQLQSPVTVKFILCRGHKFIIFSIIYLFILLWGYFNRIKDSNWVYGSYDHSVEEADQWARGHGQSISLYVDKVYPNETWKHKILINKFSDRQGR